MPLNLTEPWCPGGKKKAVLSPRNLQVDFCLCGLECYWASNGNKEVNLRRSFLELGSRVIGPRRPSANIATSASASGSSFMFSVWHGWGWRWGGQDILGCIPIHCSKIWSRAAECQGVIPSCHEINWAARLTPVSWWGCAVWDSYILDASLYLLSLGPELSWYGLVLGIGSRMLQVMLM